MKFFSSVLCMLVVLAPMYSFASVYGKLTDACVNSSTKHPVCADGSVSYAQPQAQGLFGWEGKCGEVALVNTLKMTCGKAWNPSGKIDAINFDLGPGTHPETLKNTLNVFSRASTCPGTRWTYYDSANSRTEFVASVIGGLQSPSKFYRTRLNGTVVRRAPVPVLVYDVTQGLFHWVTVVDVTGFEKNLKVNAQKKCRVIFNQYDDQHTLTCNQFAKLAEDVGSAYYVGGLYLGRFVRVKQVRQ